MWCLRFAKREEKDWKTANGSKTSSIEQEIEDYYNETVQMKFIKQKQQWVKICNIWFYDKIISEELSSKQKCFYLENMGLNLLGIFTALMCGTVPDQYHCQLTEIEVKTNAMLSELVFY